MNELTRQNGNCHRGVHEKQHVEKEETKIAQYFCAVVANVVIECTDQKSHENVSEQTEIHERLKVNHRSEKIPKMETYCYRKQL